MSEFVRGSKKPAFDLGPIGKIKDPKTGAARATIKTSPGGLTIASVSLASAMLASGAQAQDAVPLPEITVQGSQGTSYQATSPSLNRVPTPLRDTPQTVNVVTEQVLRDQAVSTARDALRNVAGVTFRAGEGGNQGDTPYIRGFSAQSDVFRDGVRDPGWYTRDIFATEAVEVYKGPAGVLFGRGSTGGVINLTTKTAVDRNFQEYSVTGNSGWGARTTGDINAIINDQASARFVFMGQRYNIAGRDNVEENRLGVAPSLVLKPNDRTKLTFSYIYQYENSVPDYGIPFLSDKWGVPRRPAPVDRNTWYGIQRAPYPDVVRDDVHIATAKAEHNITNDLKVTNTSRYMYVNHFQRNVFPEPNASVPNPPNLNTNWQTAPNRAQVATINTMATNQTDVLAKFNTGTWQHTATTGLDVSQETRDFLRNQFSGQANTNFVDPDANRAGGAPGLPTASQKTFGWANNIGLYLADQVKLNQYFELLGSVRFDSFHFRQNAPLADVSVQNLSHVDNVFSHRYGAVFHPTPNSSIYVMRGTSFNPTADNLSISVATPAAAISQINLGPEKNETSEAGVKVDLLDGRLSLASAVFLTEKTNFRVVDPTNSTVTALSGKIRATGAEASVTGYITQQWQVIMTYTYVHARVVATTIPNQMGAEPTNTPTNAFSLWTTYDVTKQFQVGFGAFYTGEVYGDIPTSITANSQSGLVPAYWRFDAMAAYKFPDNKTTLQFNVYNITDEYYFASAYSNWAVPGASRTFALTLRHRI